MHPLMRPWFLAFLLFIVQAFAVTVPHTQGLQTQAGNTPDSPRVTVSPYGRLPVFFEPNYGHFDARVRFASTRRGVNLFLTDGNAVLVVKTPPVEKSGTACSARTPTAICVSTWLTMTVHCR